jgi:hypothetical protein
MKKLMSLLLAGLFVLAAVGCSQPSEPAPDADAGADTAEPANEEAQEGS